LRLWFQRLFSHFSLFKEEQQAHAKIRSVSQDVANKNALAEKDFQFLTDIDACYFAWVTGRYVDGQGDDALFEHVLLDYLDGVARTGLAGSNLIPRIPGVMLELLKSLRDDDVSAFHLTLLIKKDVVLLAAVLNEVNSSFFNPSKPVIDLNNAIQLLGHNRLRMVLAKVSLKPIFNAQLGDFTRVAAPRIWEHSQARAIASSLLAKKHRADPFLAFLAGMMLDVGLMVALRVFDRGSETGTLPVSDSFRNAFRKRARAMSSQIARVWALPESVMQAIEEQGREKSGAALSTLGRVLQMGDFLGKACVLVNAGQLDKEKERFRDVLSKDEADYLYALISGSKLQ
jgi:HD-like signal output (HDOD) protein